MTCDYKINLYLHINMKLITKYSHDLFTNKDKDFIFYCKFFLYKF
jgi:hypothetical protein